ncbi:MAG: phospholipid carrier-dependent glycosyltransferase [Pseudomonadota bacterium]
MFLNRQVQHQMLSIGVLFIAFLTYYNGYENPDKLLWDENYHITSAYKYLNHIFFMEPHPPLGKLIIALGEWFAQLLFGINVEVNNAAIVNVEHIKDTPINFSFSGLRFFPVLFSVFSALIFFNIVCQLIKNHWIAFLFTFFYLFDNSLIVHSRSVMLESIQLFFILAAIYYFLLRLEKHNSAIHYFILGVIIGLAVAVKVNSLILLLLFPFLFFYPLFCRFLLNQKNKIEPLQKIKIFSLIKSLLNNGLALLVAIFMVVAISFYLHFFLGTELSENKYDASAEYISVIKNKQTRDLSNYWMMLKENLSYMSEYEKNVPRYKAYDKDENGSLAFAWPFAYKAISYRWDKEGELTQYLYLFANPLIWLFALLGFILSVVYLLAIVFFQLPIKDKKNLYLIAGFSCLYVSYMLVMFQIERVMYLYHYFIPLIFSMFLFFLVFKQIFLLNNKFNKRLLYLGLIILSIEIYYCYTVFKPLSYHQPISANEFERLQWFDYWDLKVVLN